MSRGSLFCLRTANFGASCLPFVSLLVLPASASAQLDQPFGKTDLMGMLQAGFQWGIMLVVIAAAIFIAIGAYYYLAASGNAELAGRGKETIQRAIMGLVIGLIGWVILNTVQTQFTTGLRPPSPIPLQ